MFLKFCQKLQAKEAIKNKQKLNEGKDLIMYAEDQRAKHSLH